MFVKEKQVVMSSGLKTSFFYLISIILLYNIKLFGMSISLNRIVLYTFFIQYIFFYYKMSIPSVFYKVWILSLSLIVYYLVIQFYNRSFDMTILLFVIEAFFIFPIGIYAFVKTFFDKINKIGIEQYLLNILLLQSISILLMLFCPTLKSITLQFVDSGVPFDKYPFRHVGLTGFTAYNMGVFLNLSLILFFSIYVNEKKLKITNLLGLLVILLASLLTSRTGIIVIGISIILLSMLKHKKIKKLFKILVMIFFILLFIGLTLFHLYPHKFAFLLWSFDIFISLTRGENVQGIDVIKNFYWEPNFKTFLIGDGLYSGKDGAYYMHTDAGYMRLILLFGFIGSFFFYFLYCVTFFYNFLFVKKYNFYLSIIYLIIIFSSFVIQYKGNIFLDGNELIKIMYLIFFYYYIQKEIKSV